MRTRNLATLVMIVLAAVTVSALDQEAIDRADELYEDDRAEAAVETLEGALSGAGSGPERAEVYWRLARATLAVGEALEDDGATEDEVLPVYEQGEQYGIDAVEADPENHLGYYWQSANIGKWGQVKGILNALFKAAPMRDLLKQAITQEPDHADSYYVLGQLYAQVPGVVSFGNDDYAVSLARKSIDLHEAELASGETDDVQHDFYIQLASHLMERNWNGRKRSREHDGKREAYRATNDPLEKGWYYEGTVEIRDQSDRDEAENLLADMIRRLEAISDRTDGQERQLERALELMAQL
ncbi:MAG: hypothetical protein ACOCWX_02975 [Spirochaetota bacterium]